MCYQQNTNKVRFFSWTRHTAIFSIVVIDKSSEQIEGGSKEGVSKGIQFKVITKQITITRILSKNNSGGDHIQIKFNHAIQYIK